MRLGLASEHGVCVWSARRLSGFRSIKRKFVAGRPLLASDAIDGDAVCVITERVARGDDKSPGVLASAHSVARCCVPDRMLFV